MELNPTILLLGSFVMIVAGSYYSNESEISVGLGLLWMAAAVMRRR